MTAKYYWPFNAAGVPTSKFWKGSSRIVCAAVASASKFWLDWAISTKVHNLDCLSSAVFRRAKGVPLVTVSNHQSCLDDPLLWGIFTWHQVLFSATYRWVPAASDICFTTKLHAYFFGLGRCVPVVRGHGVYQQSMNFLVEQLDKGDWVHTFPEGKVNLSKEPMRLKWGVGRLVSDSSITPIVIPIWHLGMDDVLPNRTPYVPQLMKKVTINVGEPMQFHEILRELRERKASTVEVRKVITDIIQDKFVQLKEDTEKLHYSKH